VELLFKTGTGKDEKGVSHVASEQSGKQNNNNSNNNNNKTKQNNINKTQTLLSPEKQEYVPKSISLSQCYCSQMACSPFCPLQIKQGMADGEN